MASKLILKKSSVPAKIPLAADLDVGELAVNLADKKLFSKDAGGTVIELGGAAASAPVTSVAGKTGAVTLVKADVGLGNVDNTSDASKPVSTAQQAALNDRVDLTTNQTVGGTKTFTGTLVAAAGVRHATSQGVFLENIAIQNYSNIPNGYIKLVTPIRTSHNQMFSIDVVGYDYSAGKSIDFTVVGYAYAASDAVINVGFSNRSSFSVNVRVALEDRGAGFRVLVIALGAETSSGVSNQAWYFQKFSATARGWAGNAGNWAASDFAFVTGETTLAAGFWSGPNINNLWMDGQTGVVTAPSFVGNSSTATALQTARAINGVGFNGSAAIDIPRVRAIDDRAIAPADGSVRYATFAFGSWANNNTNPYGDAILMRGYADASGGNDNLVMFRKDAIGMRIWQQAFGSSTPFATYKDVAFTDSSITGSAATLTTSRTLTLGSTGKAFNGSADVSWTRQEIGVPLATSSTAVALENTEACIAYVGNPLLGAPDGALYSHVYSAAWKHQIQGDYRTGQIAIRGKNNGVWQPWRTVIDSVNVGTFAPTIDQYNALQDRVTALENLILNGRVGWDGKLD